MKGFDKDKSNNISFSEFEEMWRYLESYRGIFDAYDADKSGYIDKNELMIVIRNLSNCFS